MYRIIDYAENPDDLVQEVIRTFSEDQGVTVYLVDLELFLDHHHGQLAAVEDWLGAMQQAARRFSARMPTPPIALLGGYSASDPLIARFVAAGAIYLNKPEEYVDDADHDARLQTLWNAHLLTELPANLGDPLTLPPAAASEVTDDVVAAAEGEPTNLREVFMDPSLGLSPADFSRLIARTREGVGEPSSEAPSQEGQIAGGNTY